MRQLSRGLTFVLMLLALLPSASWAATATQNVAITVTRAGLTFPLTVSNGVLNTASGNPYLILGDSPQGANSIPLCSAGNTFALCQNSTDTLPANATFVAYARDRQAQGFNSLWINILCEAYTACNNNGATSEGTFPFTTQLSGTGFAGGFNGAADTCPGGAGPPNGMDCWDMSSGINSNGTATGANAAYWSHIDGYFKIAAQFGLQVMAAPLAADACNTVANGGSIGFMYFNNSQLKPANINAFADFLYNRYGNPASSNYAPNLIWWIGNDYNCWDSVNRPSHFVAGSDNVVFAFVSRLHTDELGSSAPHLIVSEVDGLATSLTDTVNTWQNVISLNGVYYVGPMYDGALLAHGQNSTTIPPMVVENQYMAEDTEGIDDGTTTGTNIAGCGSNQTGGASSLQGDPNACPLRERAQFWAFVLAGGYAGTVGGNHYTWTFNQGWNNGTVTGGANACTGTSGAGHSPCLDTTANTNLKNAVAFLQANIKWYQVVPDMTRVADANGFGTGQSIAQPLLTGCYVNNACTNYYIGQSYAHGLTDGVRRGTLQNLVPTSGATSDGLAGIVYVPGISTSCLFYQTIGAFANCVPASGLQITVNNARVNGGSNLTAAWYDPSGPMTVPSSTICSPSGTPCNAGSQVYTTPSSGHTDTASADWVLLITVD